MPGCELANIIVMTESPRAQSVVTVWDLPVRLFHWVLVILVGVQIGSGFTGGNAMIWHERCGTFILALITFRLIWGLIGSTHARFADFLYGARTTIAFGRDLLARRARPYLGHNPLGGWNVLFMLLAILAQAATGLLANDDIATEGPLAHLISKETSDAITVFHHFNGKLIIALAGLHIAAVLYHGLALRENLVRAMVTGRKPVSGETPIQPSRMRSPWLALAVLAGTVLVVYVVILFAK
jgi:cytochrome b